MTYEYLCFAFPHQTFVFKTSLITRQFLYFICKCNKVGPFFLSDKKIRFLKVVICRRQGKINSNVHGYLITCIKHRS